MTEKKYVLLNSENVELVDKVAKGLGISRNRAANLILTNKKVRQIIDILLNTVGE